MTAIKVIVGMAIFFPMFIGVGKIVGYLSDRHRTGIAFVVLAAGLFFLLVLTSTYAHAVR